jgi:Protein of unknown function (DUF1036)
MWLQFHNAHGHRLWLSVGYYSPGCEDGSNWAKRGWYELDPNQSAIVLWTTNTYSTFYAEGEDGAHWSGPYVTELPFNAFDWCWFTGSTQGEDVGMRLITVSNAWAPWIGTLNLT